MKPNLWGVLFESEVLHHTDPFEAAFEWYDCLDEEPDPNEQIVVEEYRYCGFEGVDGLDAYEPTGKSETFFTHELKGEDK